MDKEFDIFFDDVPPVDIPHKDYSILDNFTNEELAQELLRRTPVGEELV
jgi:hypothetical protein